MREKFVLFMVVVSILVLIGVVFQRAYQRTARRRDAQVQSVPQVGGGRTTRTVTAGGRERSYVVFTPEGPTPGGPVPVILAFHGGFGTPESFRRATLLHEQAGREGFVVVYPEGFRFSWNAGDCCGEAMRRNVDDVAFVRALLDDLGTVINIDPARIFATGFSNGGKMVYRLACELSDRIAAIAPVGAATSMADAACRPQRAVPILHLHGLADRFAPFEGGLSEFESAGIQRSVPETIEFWVRRNRCDGEPRVITTGAITRTSYRNCAGGADVQLVTIEGWEHRWPDESAGIRATDAIIGFFQSHPMTGP